MLNKYRKNEQEVNRVMKSMESMDGDTPHNNAFDGDAGGRHTRALAKRCILLTEENKVRSKACIAL